MGKLCLQQKYQCYYYKYYNYIDIVLDIKETAIVLRFVF